MHFFYIDEAGCTGVLTSATAAIQPIFSIGGIILEQRILEPFTWDFLNLKERFYPGLRPTTFLDWIKIEIKGSELRKQIREGGRDKHRHALGVMEKLLDLFDKYNIKLVGRIFIKDIGAPIDGAAMYASSIQTMSASFQRFLEEKNEAGIMVLDSRNKLLNTNVSHSIFTQKFKRGGDSYNRILDMPLFGHSDNHAGIQAADLLCSGFIFPMAAYVYCLGHIHNGHADYSYHSIRDRFGIRLKKMQFRYQDENQWWSGGLRTSDALNHQSSALLFGPK